MKPAAVNWVCALSDANHVREWAEYWGDAGGGAAYSRLRESRGVKRRAHERVA